MPLKALRAVAVMAAAVALLSLASSATALGSDTQESTKERAFARGLPNTPDFFPIAVWLQQPQSASKYKSIGINTFVGLWRPPTASGLAELERQGIHLIVAQSPEALAFQDSQVIRGWLQVDEPDNAQPDGKGGHGECILPDEVVRRYKEMRLLDASRPVYLGFGQAVANPRWFGRGANCSAIPPEAYYRAASLGADIIAFDIYPVAEFRQLHVMGRLDLVGRGVRNLKQWAPPGTPIWADIETTHINNPDRRPSPDEIFSEVWMAIINGASGINYFVHEWKPSFREDGVFRYPDTVAAITLLNKQLQEYAPLLNSATIENAIDVQAPIEIAHMMKRGVRGTYLFAVNMQSKGGRARISFSSPTTNSIDVIREGRTIKLDGNTLEDSFGGYEVHIYQLRKH